MAPLPLPLTLLSRPHTLNPPPDFAGAAAQWVDPTDVLTVLMIIGGDIVQRALASMAGSQSVVPFAPVAFSFGWVSYSFSAMLSAIGSRRLLPDPDCDCILVNAQSGYQRQVKSFALARLYRDHHPHHKGDKGLTVAFFDTYVPQKINYNDKDWMYLLSVLAIVLQLILSIIPAITHRRYMVFILTLSGTILALITTSLPQWKKEKWAARSLQDEKRRNVVCLSAGNGSRSVMVIISEGIGLNLEDLAAGRDSPSHLTSFATFILAIFWIMHLITMQGLETDSWFSLGIGALGMLQNAVAAGGKRSPEALGFNIRSTGKKIHNDQKVIKALKEAEETEPYVGLSLLPIYFPGELRPDEVIWRDNRRKALAGKQKSPVISATNETQDRGRMTSPAETIIHPSYGQNTPDTENVAVHSPDISASPERRVDIEENMSTL